MDQEKHIEQERHENIFSTPGQVAILIDGGFFIRRVNFLSVPEKRNDPDYVVQLINILCWRHAKRLGQSIYRIFFYDCPPFGTGLHNPLTGRFIKFQESNQFKFKTAVLDKLRFSRKVALRLGHLNIDKSCKWTISTAKIKDLLSKKITVDDLDPEKDILPNFRQKQVDLKIGIDIASMALKHQVKSIVLVAGDGDFVPASKLARREGVDFILDPMWAEINPELNEHIDGLHSVLFGKKAGK